MSVNLRERTVWIRHEIAPDRRHTLVIGDDGGEFARTESMDLHCAVRAACAYIDELIAPSVPFEGLLPRAIPQEHRCGAPDPMGSYRCTKRSGHNGKHHQEGTGFRWQTAPLGSKE